MKHVCVYSVELHLVDGRIVSKQLRVIGTGKDRQWEIARCRERAERHYNNGGNIAFVRLVRQTIDTSDLPDEVVGDYVNYLGTSEAYIKYHGYCANCKSKRVEIAQFQGFSIIRCFACFFEVFQDAKGSEPLRSIHLTRDYKVWTRKVR